MRLHLVTIHAFPSPQAVPLAAACIKAFLDSRQPTSHRLHVSLSDFFSGDSVNDMHRVILKEKPDLVGFSMYVWNREQCSHLARMLRRELPSLVLFAGGPEATADPAGVLAQAPLDFLVVGEGEVTLGEALDRIATGLSLEGLAGVAVRKGVPVGRTPVVEPDLLPSPYLSGILDGYMTRGIPWQISRGCPYGCEFCFDGMGDRSVRRYSMGRLEKELDYLAARGVNQVFVLDSTFNMDAKRARAILRLIRKKAPHVHFHFEVRCELLDAEQARLFGEIKCSLQIGLQTADPSVSAAVGRSLDRRVFSEKIRLLNREGVAFGLDLIYGLPGDDRIRFQETLDFALRLYPNSLDIFPLSLLPGTPLAARAARIGLRHMKGPPYTLTSSPTFPEEDMAVARRLGAACDIFYSRGKSVAWFNGVISSLRLTPSSFLAEFAGWLTGRAGGGFSEAEYGDEDIWKMQRDFLADIFPRRKARRFLAAALDFVDYHFHYAAALMAVSPTLPAKGELRRADILQRPLATTRSTRLAAFSYDILDLLESGEPDLRRICGSLRPAGSFAAIYPCRGQVFTESLAESYYRLLERLDGKSPAGETAARLGIPAKEAREFLFFAAAEGIVELRGSLFNPMTP